MTEQVANQDTQDHGGKVATDTTQVQQQTGTQQDGAKQTAQVNGDGKPLAAGGEVQQQQEKPYWPEDWREKAAQHIAAGDEKAYKRELKRLERIADPAGMYGMYREAETKLTSGGLIKVPGKDAKPEEIAEYHKSLGVPEKPEDYFKNIKLENGAVIGEADKPLADTFAAALHPAGATPQVVNAALNWYFANQEKQAAALDESDDKFRQGAQQALKEEYGPALKRMTNNISSLFTIAPGGTDLNNEKALYTRLMGGRMADGSIIGNDPDMVRFLVALALDKNPAASVVEDGDQTGQSVDTEIASIEKRMREDRINYFKDEKAQARYRQLIDARGKIQERKRA